MHSYGEMELSRLKHIGKEDHFPWWYLDTTKWPGRELKWVWCNPILATMLAVSFVGTLIIYFAGG